MAPTTEDSLIRLTGLEHAVAISIIKEHMDLTRQKARAMLHSDEFDKWQYDEWRREVVTCVKITAKLKAQKFV